MPDYFSQLSKKANKKDILFRGKFEYAWQPKTLEQFLNKQFDRLDVNKNENERTVQPPPHRLFLS